MGVDEFGESQAADTIAGLEAVNERLTKRVQEEAAEKDRYRALLGLVENTALATPKPPRWAAPRKPKRGDKATAFGILSDMHYDEIVSPDATRGLNAYSRDIAHLRTRRCAEKFVELAERTGLDYEAFVMFLLGDSLTGWIHDELVHGTEAPPAKTVIDYTPLIVAVLAMIADHFGQVHVVCLVGNHGRTTHKQWSKYMVETNWDWVLAENVRTYLRDDDRFTWDIPLSADAVTPIYGTTILSTHGNFIRGGGGVGGIWPPLLRGVHKKRQLYSSQGIHFDVMFAGHWHQFTPAVRQGFVLNGTTKGADEWSVGMGFPPSPPEQTFGVVTREHGITQVLPAFCGDRKAEGW